MKNDPRSYDRNFYNCIKKPEKKKLKLNRDKTELLVINSRYLPRPSLDSIVVGNCRVCPFRSNVISRETCKLCLQGWLVPSEKSC